MCNFSVSQIYFQFFFKMLKKLSVCRSRPKIEANEARIDAVLFSYERSELRKRIESTMLCEECRVAALSRNLECSPRCARVGNRGIKTEFITND